MTNQVASQAGGLKNIDALIAKVKPAYKTAMDTVQEAAIAIVEHAMTYDDCSRALTLCRAVPLNQARSLIQYFMAVSPIGVLFGKDKKDDKVRLLPTTSKAYNAFDMEKARALSWWTMDEAQSAKEIQQIYAGGVFDQVLAMLTKAAEGKGTSTKEYTEDAMIAAQALKEHVTKFRASHVAAALANANSNDNTGEGEEEAVPTLPVANVA